jgi:hypothetical protein
VIFTEFMPNPEILNDSDGEWIEVYNTTQQDLDLSGLVLSDLNSSEIISPDEPLVISAGGYMAFAKAVDFGAFAPAAWMFSTISLNNDGGDTITLSVADGEAVDTVDYDGGDYGAGVAVQLSSDKLDETSNDDMAKWCAATVDQGNGDLGTPAAPNELCGGGDELSCTDVCYEHDESSTPGGSNTCFTDCDCDGARTCSDFGFCDGDAGLCQ